MHARSCLVTPAAFLVAYGLGILQYRKNKQAKKYASYAMSKSSTR